MSDLTMPEPPDRALVGLFDPTGQTVPLVFERDDAAAAQYDIPTENRWWVAYRDDTERAHTWTSVLAEAESQGMQVARLYRADDPRVILLPDAAVAPR